MRLGDGPFGIRNGTAVYVQAERPEDCSATAFPTGTHLAATWNVELLAATGEAIGREAVAADIAGIWGPAFNMMRSPLCGRNFEYFGEDPHLAGWLAVAYIRGMQATGCIACAKHFACNNQETARHESNSVVSERALREIYLAAFETAVKHGGVWSVMNAYNKLNGTYCAENHRLQQDILKNEWGFRGYVISDWFAVESTKATFDGGCDVEMPPKFLITEKLLPLVENGELSRELLDDKLRRVLRALFSMEIDRRPAERPHPARRLALLKRHETVALNVAREGLVLLKNADAALPLDLTGIKRLAVIGESAAAPVWHGGGSSRVTPRQAVSPLQVIHEKLLARDSATEVTYAAGVAVTPLPDTRPVESAALRSPTDEGGVLGEYFASADCSGTPFYRRLDPAPDFFWHQTTPVAGMAADAQFSVRWTGTLRPPQTGWWRFGGWTGTTERSGMRIWLDHQLLIEGASDDLAREIKQVKRIHLDAGKNYALRVEYYKQAGTPLSWFKLLWSPDTGAPADPAALFKAAVDAARQADAVLLFASVGEEFGDAEGRDRTHLSLPEKQDELIQAVAAVNPRVTVVLFAGAPVVMRPWLDQVKAVLWAGYPGQEGGQAIVETLLGEVNPSGKLPFTLGRRREDWPDFGNFTDDLRAIVNETNGVFTGYQHSVKYDEGIFIGYRHFDRQKLAVEFPFGHGLSYTRFTYSRLSVPATAVAGDEVRVSLRVENAGPVAGQEVVQLYVADPVASVSRPEKELKGFAKVALAPGESRDVHFVLDARAFAFYSEATHAWVVEPGEFVIQIGASSRDLRLTQTLTLE